MEVKRNLVQIMWFTQDCEPIKSGRIGQDAGWDEYWKNGTFFNVERCILHRKAAARREIHWNWGKKGFILKNYT
jgi:hypothetical protein